MIQQASFRGIKFHITSDSLETGRRVAVHEFPYVANPTVEDMGKRPRQFEIRAYLAGTDVLDQYNNLIIAIETAGKGELIHPVLGSIQAQCTEAVRFERHSNEANIIRLGLRFIEVVASTLSIVELADSTQQNNLKAVKTSTERDFITAAKKLPSPTQVIQSLTSKIKAINNKSLQISGGINDFANDIRLLELEAGSLINAPQRLFAALDGVLAQANASATTLAKALNVTVDLETSGSKTTSQPLDNFVRRRKTLLKVKVVTKTTLMINSLQMETYGLPVLNELLALEKQGDDNWYQVVHALFLSTSKVLLNMPVKKVKQTSFDTDMPALLQLYAIAGSVARIDQYVALNNIANPFFPPKQVIWYV